MGEVIIWVAIAALVAVCLRNIMGDLRHGTCSGCSSCGNCSHCDGSCQEHAHGGHESARSSMTNDDLRQLLKTTQP